ncbi:MAG: hypothetical protein SGI84_12890 [Gemmatimonadota bacterium]|nr:hypothetical protein [Gemmatimonadota bacterium]
MSLLTMTTAEWLCTKCGVTNRKLVPKGTPEAKDRCVHCRARHLVSPDDRPVRWRSRAA